MPNWGTVPTVPAVPQRNSMPIPYGWDQSLTQMAAGGMVPGSVSVPTTPVSNPYLLQQSGLQNFAGYSMGTQFKPQTNSFYAGTVSGGPMGGLPGTGAAVGFGAAGTAHIPPSHQRPLVPGGMAIPSQSMLGNQSGAKNIVSSDPKQTGGTQNSGGFNLVPNVDFDVWGDADTFFDQQEQMDSLPNTSAANTFKKTHRRNNSDLIQLGFEGVMTAEEKEYFSLEYFDPLHKKGRTASISSPSASNYFFAKPPEETALVSTERDNWVTFDDSFGFSQRGAEDRADVVASKTQVEDPSVQHINEDDGKVVFVDCLVYLFKFSLPVDI